MIEKKIPFFKMTASSNDFIFLDKKYAFETRFVSTLMCHRKKGIGCDQLITYHEEIENKIIHVDIMNSNGSFAEVCGNSFLCAGDYFSHKHSWHDFTIMSKNKLYSVKHENNASYVNMGSFLAKELTIPNLSIPYYKYSKMFYVNVGNPHVIVFLKDSLKKEDTITYGPLIENHKMFPKKTNVSFVRVIDENTIDISTWERGIGYSDSCGSASSASFIAAFAQNLVNNSANISSEGGSTQVSLNDNNEIIISGKTSLVFEGNYILTPNSDKS